MLTSPRMSYQHWVSVHSSCLGMWQWNDPWTRKIHTLVLQYALSNLKQGAATSVIACKFPQGFLKKKLRKHRKCTDHAFRVKKKINERGFKFIAHRHIILICLQKQENQTKSSLSWLITSIDITTSQNQLTLRYNKQSWVGYILMWEMLFAGEWQV